MGYSSYLKPRPETISEDGIEGIIDLANLRSGFSGKIEANPELFFSLTYPTSDILKVIEQINIRFSSKKVHRDYSSLMDGDACSMDCSGNLKLTMIIK